MMRKLTNKEKKMIAGISGVIVGLYMVFILNNSRGWFVTLVGGLFLMKANG